MGYKQNLSFICLFGTNIAAAISVPNFRICVHGNVRERAKTGNRTEWEEEQIKLAWVAGTDAKCPPARQTEQTIHTQTNSSCQKCGTNTHTHPSISFHPSILISLTLISCCVGGNGGWHPNGFIEFYWFLGARQFRRRSFPLLKHAYVGWQLWMLAGCIYGTFAAEGKWRRVGIAQWWILLMLSSGNGKKEMRSGRKHEMGGRDRHWANWQMESGNRNSNGQEEMDGRKDPSAPPFAFGWWTTNWMLYEERNAQVNVEWHFYANSNFIFPCFHVCHGPIGNGSVEMPELDLLEFGRSCLGKKCE